MNFLIFLLVLYLKCYFLTSQATLVLPEYSNSLHPLQWFECQLHYFEIYFPVKNSYTSLLMSWYCLCKIDLQICHAASEDLLEKQQPLTFSQVAALKRFEKDAMDISKLLKNTLHWIICKPSKNKTNPTPRTEFEIPAFLPVWDSRPRPVCYVCAKT